MPERESASPQHDPHARLGELFDNLPAARAPQPPVSDETRKVPVVPDQPSAPPPSRRAARAAAEAQPSDAFTAILQPAAASASIPEDSAGAHARATNSGGSGSLEELFDTHSADESGSEPPRKRRRTGCLVALIIVLVLIGGAAAGGVWVMNTYGEKINDVFGWGEPKDWEAGDSTGEEALVTVRANDTGRQVSTALFEAGVTKTDTVFYDMLIDEVISVTFYPGVYTLEKKMTAAAALEALQDPANKLENSVSMREGATVAAMLPSFAETLQLPLADFEAAVADPSAYGVDATTLEGWLFPAVYTFDPGVTAEDAIAAMVARTQQSLDKAGVSADDAQRVLTIASIVQREGHTADFDKVSRVIENRLDPGNDETHGLLQMDSTAQYGYGLTHEGPVSSWPWADVSTDENAWNTYVHKGLPATPISSPSDAAIHAAQNPADGPWFYFVTVNLDTGETVFSATYAEQQAAEAKYRQWCKDNPDGGCY